MKHDAKLMQKQGKDMQDLIDALNLLATGKPMPEKYKDHQLGGNLKDLRECHIAPDWILMYKRDEDKLILLAIATGSHSGLLKL
jgi:mRNA interferase YafQ